MLFWYLLLLIPYWIIVDKACGGNLSPYYSTNKYASSYSNIVYDKLQDDNRDLYAKGFGAGMVLFNDNE